MVLMSYAQHDKERRTNACKCMKNLKGKALRLSPNVTYCRVNSETGFGCLQDIKND